MDDILIKMMASYYLYVVAFGVHLFIVRVKAVSSGEVSPKYFKTYTGDISERLKTLGNHFNNQFQAPVIFFIICLMTLQQEKVTQTTLILAGLFLFTRWLHSYFFLTRNHVLKRAGAFFTGVGIMTVMAAQLLI